MEKDFVAWGVALFILLVMTGVLAQAVKNPAGTSTLVTAGGNDIAGLTQALEGKTVTATA